MAVVLPAPFRTQKGEDLTVRHRQIEALHRLKGAITLGQTLDFDQAVLMRCGHTKDSANKDGIYPPQF